MADFIAMILTHDILIALFPYIIIIMLGIIISKANKILKKQDKIIKHFEIKEESKKDDNETTIFY